MELRELITKLPPRSEVVVLTADDGAIPLVPERFYVDTDNVNLLKYQHAEVKAIEYNFRCCAYQVAVERVTTNMDKLKELFPYAKFIESFGGHYMLMNIDNDTYFTKEWLYTPYNKEEGKEED